MHPTVDQVSQKRYVLQAANGAQGWKQQESCCETGVNMYEAWHTHPKGLEPAVAGCKDEESGAARRVSSRSPESTGLQRRIHFTCLQLTLDGASLQSSLIFDSPWASYPWSRQSPWRGQKNSRLKVTTAANGKTVSYTHTCYCMVFCFKCHDFHATPPEVKDLL